MSETIPQIYDVSFKAQTHLYHAFYLRTTEHELFLHLCYPSEKSRAAGFEVWVTSRSEEGRELAKALGAHQSFFSDEVLPKKVQVVIDNIGADSWNHSISSLTRGGRLVMLGGTTGFDVALNLLPVFANQLTITGSIMGTLKDMENMINLIAQTGIEPKIGAILPMEHAEEGFRTMLEGKVRGKIVFTR